jgi:hypothetical protein
MPGRRDLKRVLEVGRQVLRDGPMYPALRARPRAHRSAAEALVELGFEPALIGRLAAAHERAAADLYPRLAERWQAEMGEGPLLGKLRDPAAPANESNTLIYLAVRALRPETVVETGTFGGLISTFILRGLEDNGTGRLVSLDLPAYEPIENAIDLALPPGKEPGWLVPDELRSRFEVILGDSRRTLPPLLARLGPIDLFVYDSLKTFRHMSFEHRSSWRALRPGGLLFSNNAFVTPAFWWFTRRKRVPFLFVGGDFGVTRKPGVAGPRQPLD